jgi:hypothetical protein
VSNVSDDAIKIGPAWGTVVDGRAKVVKRRFRPVCRFDEVKQLRLREYYSAEEEEKLLNLNPAVQKTPRDAELYADTKDGRAVLIATLDQAGLLLDQAMRIGRMMGVPVQNERKHLEPSPSAA